ncbi:hypothetical protein HWE04_02125 [Herbaspirillum sp. C7C2]|uniref:hypothetical protein n=1 Tax=Herbaspirillum sp. C7C2 TaxID=2736666 RepID=UPI001F51DFEA|nr:hypothetical protein [Herbaspirillum sp. C7C2]MCI1012632.1 hypothetical protein [Herbaspirillum sp. C7C2]
MQFSKYWKSWAAFFFGVVAIGYAIWHFKYDFHEANVRRVFADPASVQIRNRHWSANGDFFCAEANAKNRYGAYIGFQRVITAFDYVFLERDGLEELPQDRDVFGHKHSAVAIKLALAKLGVESTLMKRSVDEQLSPAELNRIAEIEGAKNLMDEMWQEQCS